MKSVPAKVCSLTGTQVSTGYLDTAFRRDRVCSTLDEGGVSVLGSARVAVLIQKMGAVPVEPSYPYFGTVTNLKENDMKLALTSFLAVLLTTAPLAQQGISIKRDSNGNLVRDTGLNPSRTPRNLNRQSGQPSPSSATGNHTVSGTVQGYPR